MTVKRIGLDELQKALAVKAEQESQIRIDLGLQKLPFTDKTQISVNGALEVFSAFQELSLAKERSLRKLSKFPRLNAYPQDPDVTRTQLEEYTERLIELASEIEELFGEAFSQKGSVEAQK